MMGLTKLSRWQIVQIRRRASKFWKLKGSELNKQLIWAEKMDIGDTDDDFDKMFRIVDSKEATEEGGEEELGLSKRGFRFFYFFCNNFLKY